MKLKPHQHRKAAQNLKNLAEKATNPEDKKYLLGTAKLFDGLADRAEKRAAQGSSNRTNIAEQRIFSRSLPRSP